MTAKVSDGGFCVPRLSPSPQLLFRRDLRSIPSATQCLDSLDARDHPLHSKRNGCLMVGQQRSLGGNDVQVRVEAGFVPDPGGPQGFCQPN